MVPVSCTGDPEVNESLGIALGLKATEYRHIVGILGRTPTYTELGMFSVMWSEHCSYKHSRRILRQFPTKGPRVLQGPGENAGVVRVDKNLAVVMKIESHNHPSFVEPYQGAATGVGGILRDIFTMGARPVALMDSLRFGPLRYPNNRRVMAGVIEGIGGYGNAIGVPTVGGELDFSPSYNQNCLMNAMAVGVIDPADLLLAKAKGAGNLVVYMGAMTGRDGIHGASLLASRGFGEKSTGHGGGISAVQVGDPFLGKLLMEACLDLAKQKLLVGMQDMGAAGLTCSLCETSAKAGTGMDVNLDKVPLRASGMTPYEIMISESQERMLLIVEPRKFPRVKKVLRKYAIPLAVLGRVVKGGRVRLKRHGRLVVDVPARAITDGVPLCAFPVPQRVKDRRNRSVRVPRARNLKRSLLNLLAEPGVGSKQPVWRQYDHMVRTNTAILPGSDAAVLRLKGTDKHIAFSTDGPSRHCVVDPYLGGQYAVAESARNVACAGGRPVAFTNGLNFANPDRPGILWQFNMVVKGMALAARELGTAVVSGNVSFYNEHKGLGIDPTPIVGMLGILDGWKPVPQWFTREGDVIILVGRERVSFAASAYLDHVGKSYGNRLVPISWPAEKALQNFLVSAASRGILTSAHDVADGGLLAALAECCASAADADGRMMGCEAEIGPGKGPLDLRLFGEGPSRAVLSVSESSLDEFRRTAGKLPWRVLGRVVPETLTLKVDGREKLSVATAELRAAREKGLRNAIG